MKLRLTVSVARLGLVTLVVFAALAATQQTTAQAQTVAADPDFWKQTAERQNTVNRLIYSQSPQAIPTTYDPVREAEEILRLQQRSLPPSNPAARSVWERLRGLTGEAKLSPAVRTLGTIGLAVGTFEIGWKIGSGINAKFLKVGVPEAIPHTNTDFRGNGFRQDLTWNTAGFDAVTGGKVIQPVDGFTWTRYTASGRYYYWKTGAPENSCDHNRVALPLGMAIQTTALAGKDCGYGADRASTDYHIAYVTEDALGAPAPIEPYTNQPYTKSSSAPTPPAQTTVEQTIESELDKPENEDLRDWLNYKLGSPGAEDPTGIGATNANIEFPERYFKWQEHGHEFPEYEDAEEYWAGAADIVERKRSGDLDVRECYRSSDGTTIYWDSIRNVLVFVRNGVIVNSYRPTGGYDYFRGLCDEEPT
jgi:hypothetical protein